MAITHSIISLHGGEIDLRNDGGFHVDVMLPAQPPLLQSKRLASGSFPAISLGEIIDP
jgi:hypothetical protein